MSKTIKTLEALRKSTWEQAKALLDHAAGENRDLDTDEARQWDDLSNNLDGIDARLSMLKRDAQRSAEAGAAFADIANTAPANGPARGRRGHLDLRTLADGVRTAAEQEGGFGVRALLAAGSTMAHPGILTGSPVDLGKPATALLDVIATRTVEDGAYSYLRQTVRTNLAAPVAVGAAKPTSVMTLERVNGNLEVVAHVSEPVHEKWLEDVDALEQFIRDEMAAGIATALEDQLLNGTGVSPALAGIVTTATGTQAYATSPLVTIRTGLAQFEAAGLKPSGVVLAASDWLAIETATLTAGGYVLGQGTNGAPLNAIQRTVWGVPVVVSAKHSAGTAVLLSEDSVGLVTDGGVEFMWGRVNDDFTKNQVRARAELRAQVEVYRPAGIIIADLTA